MFPGNVTIMSPGERVGGAAKGRVGRGIVRQAQDRGNGRCGGAGDGGRGAGRCSGNRWRREADGEKLAQASTQASAKDSALEASVARLDAEIVTLKASLEHNSKTTTSQLNKAGDRLDRVEKAQAEPVAKLAKLSEAVDKLRTAQASATPAAAAPAPARDVTGSIPQQVAAATPSAPPVPQKPEVARLPTVEGWVLRDVANGIALIESRRGMYEVYAGDPIPGLGRVDAIRKQDGRWVVVTSKGLIVAR